MSLICCDEQFDSLQGLKRHLGVSTEHNRCRRCRKGFIELASFEQHMRNANFHKASVRGLRTNDGAIYGRITSQGQHLLTAPSPGKHQYSGIPSILVKPVFKAACTFRFSNPDAADIISFTGTQLDAEVVSAIVEGALRLLPCDNTPCGMEARREKMLAKALKASEAEVAFVQNIRMIEPQLLNESQQRERIKTDVENGVVGVVKLTPDILFDRPVNLCGSDCKWVEYKNTFGFKTNPYVHSKHKAQLSRYSASFGGGMVVYKLGFECDLFNVAGLTCMREKEVLRWIDSQVAR